MSAPLAAWHEHDGALLRLRLARPRANVLDAAMIAALRVALERHLTSRSLRGVLLDAEGPDFCFGASVEEHLPGRCTEMLRAVHGLVRELLACPVPLLVAVRGRCLGGGLEVAACAHLLFAAPDAALGQPEIKLGVFAPAASCLLPECMPRAHAEDLLLSGRSVSAGDAQAMGLVNVVAEDPEAAALAWFEAHAAGSSASSLRLAVRAARADLCRRVDARLDEVEALYLDQLMSTRDAVEGLEAFIEKRPAAWVHA